MRADGLDVAVLHDDTSAWSGVAGKEDLTSVWEAIEAVEAALVRLGHRSRRVSLGPGVLQAVHALAVPRPDVVFHLAETVAGDTAGEARVAALLELLGLAHTSESAEVLLAARDKRRVHAILRHAGVRTPPHAVSMRGELPAELPPAPWIVKPALEDGSVGITADAVVADRSALAARIGALRGVFAAPILIESFIAGREFQVGIVGGEWLPITEVDLSRLPAALPKIAGYASKWKYQSDEFKGIDYICPASLPDEQRTELLAQAGAAVQALGICRCCRLDVRQDERGFFVLDVNPNPDLSPVATMRLMAEQAGWGFDGLVARLLEQALVPARPC